MHAGPHLLARRTALTLGAVAIAASGCDDGDSSDPADAPSSTPSSTPPADPDTALVDAVLSDLGRAEALALGAGFADLAGLHRAHIEALDGPEPSSPAGRASRESVRRAEQRLQKQLVHASVVAESGALAQLLASMSAAVSQRLV